LFPLRSTIPETRPALSKHRQRERKAGENRDRSALLFAALVANLFVLSVIFDSVVTKQLIFVYEKYFFFILKASAIHWATLTALLAVIISELQTNYIEIFKRWGYMSPVTPGS